jgi:shikimate kinase
MEDRTEKKTEVHVDLPALKSRSSILDPRSSIFLIGYRGTGKSTVARLLAARLGWNWLDADAVLEARAGRTVREIFADEGEAGFRDHEAQVLKELAGCQRCVIATGGGVVLRHENRRLMRSAGPVIWLTADAETIWKRLQEDATTAERRPALTVGGLAEVRQLLEIREPWYRECASLTVDTAGRSPEDVAVWILQHWPYPTPGGP